MVVDFLCEQRKELFIVDQCIKRPAAIIDADNNVIQGTSRLPRVLCGYEPLDSTSSLRLHEYKTLAWMELLLNRASFAEVAIRFALVNCTPDPQLTSSPVSGLF
jgi:hypothetical protein